MYKDLGTRPTGPIAADVSPSPVPPRFLTEPRLPESLTGRVRFDYARPTATHARHLLESFVAGELARQLTWSETEAVLCHWRDRTGAEVDLILETSDGRIVAIEVKAAIDVHENDFRSIRTLQNRLGEQFVAGVVIHCGDRPRPFGPQLWSIPVGTL